MQRRIRLACLSAVALPALAFAGGFNKTYLVPAFLGCAGPATCAPQRESLYRFDSAVLRNSASRFLVPGKVAFMFEIKGVRDGGGNLVTTNTADRSDDFKLVSIPGQITITGLGTFPADAIPEVVLPLDLKNGAGKLSFKTPEATPPGLVSDGGGIVVLDNQGKRLAVVGAMSKP
jgi:hypothetical protein